MRLTVLRFTFAAAIAWSTVANAAPTTYDFSYRFASGDVVTGSFTGTPAGNLITGLTDISVFINGVPFAGNGNLVNLGWIYNQQLPGNPGTAVASFDGTQNAFTFREIGEGKVFASNPYFGDSASTYAAFFDGATSVWEGPGASSSIGPYVPSNWSVTVHASVTIDIKPGIEPNIINLRSIGRIPVAVLSTDTFDALQVDWETVGFGPDSAAEAHGRGHVVDVDADGDMDLLFHFNTWETGIACGDTRAALTGETFAGEVITGSDAIITVKCP